jgi:hypothetical protein
LYGMCIPSPSEFSSTMPARRSKGWRLPLATLALRIELPNSFHCAPKWWADTQDHRPERSLPHGDPEFR